MPVIDAILLALFVGVIGWGIGSTMQYHADRRWEERHLGHKRHSDAW